MWHALDEREPAPSPIPFFEVAESPRICSVLQGCLRSLRQSPPSQATPPPATPTPRCQALKLRGSARPPVRRCASQKSAGWVGGRGGWGKLRSRRRKTRFFSVFFKGLRGKRQVFCCFRCFEGLHVPGSWAYPSSITLLRGKILPSLSQLSKTHVGGRSWGQIGLYLLDWNHHTWA